tara:strand:+ start:343 stop:1185 length:843 start_codon:yes stop_codon:yes gene_type:complete
MRILITGGRGFIGSHFVNYAISNGHSVLVVDNESAPPVGEKNSKASYFKKCVSGMEPAKAFEPDVLIHLGEYSRVEASFDNSFFAMNNIVGNISHILEFCKVNKCKLIYAGSSTKFGDALSPYSVSKTANTEIVKQCCELFGIDYAITYFYNAYGLGERASGEYSTVIEKFIQAKLSGEPVVVNGTGSQCRNFTHVDDIVSGLYSVMMSGSGDGYGIGSDQSLSINEVIKLIGLNPSYSESTKGNRTIADLNVEKTKKLGWEAKHSLKSYINNRLALHIS